jgi:hypothetical protein
MHMGFQMNLLLEAFVSHSLHMHGFHPACISYMPQTCGTINVTVLYYHVASEDVEGDDVSDRTTAYTHHRYMVSPPCDSYNVSSVLTHLRTNDHRLHKYKV